MNRWDEIQAAARDVADWVCTDPEDRNHMAGDLIKLCGLMVSAVGKGVATEGESAQNDALKYGEEVPGEAAAAHNRYMVGEQLQTAARTVQEEATGADLERYERSGLKPVWVAQGRAAGRLTAAANQAAEAVQGTAHENDARPRDERPALFAPGAEAYYRKALGLDLSDFEPKRQPCVQDDAAARKPWPRHTWVTATDGDTDAPLGWQHCGVCGVRRCTCVTSPFMIEGPGVDCATHGDAIAQHCYGERCQACGNPSGEGVHGLNQGFGGCV